MSIDAERRPRSSVATVKAHVAGTIGPIAHAFNLSVDAFGEQYGDLKKGSAFGHLEMVDAYGTELEPAPVTPTFGSGPYELLAGTIISSLGTSPRSDIPKKAFLAPTLSTGRCPLSLVEYSADVAFSRKHWYIPTHLL